ncbi:hypothetical protein JOM56_010975 [Amanita muscaria]
MIPPLPNEVLASAIGHLEGNRKTLKRVSLASRCLCFLAQELLFSTITIAHSTDIQKLLELEKIFLASPRGENIVLAIRTLSFRNCSNLLYLYDSNDPPLRILQFIADHAKRLRAVHFGPFFREDHLLWNCLSEELKFTLVRLLTMAEKIIIEGVYGVPTLLFPKLGNLKYLDLSGSYLLPDSLKPHSLPSLQSLPSPQSLTLHSGIIGQGSFNAHYLFATLRLLSFSNLRVLYLYTPFAPGRNGLYRDMISLCDCNRLESLRFYIEGDDTVDHNINPIINLGPLTSLRSLYVIVNVKDSFGCLASIVNTLSLPQTHLKELALSINTHDPNLEEDPWLEEMIIEVELHSESWKCLDSKLAQVFEAWDDTHVVIQFPPVDPILNDDVYCFIEDQLPEISEHMHRRFHLSDFNFRDIVTPYFSFREGEDQARIVEDFFQDQA